MKSKADLLWEAQIREYPHSRRLTSREVADWVFEKGLSIEQQKERAYHVAVALQWDEVVWYRTERADAPATCVRPAGGWMGCRYGVEGSEYLSGFTYL